MRKGKLFVSGMLAAALTFGVILAGCDNGTSPDGGGTTTIILSGILSSDGSSTEAATQTFRAEVGSDNSISGKLKDGSITFDLTGEYNPVTKVFSMQAPSTLMIFSIVGKLNAVNAIDPDSISASVKIKDSNTGEWTGVILAVASSDQTVDSPVNAGTNDVTFIPAYCRGKWTEQINKELGRSQEFILTKNSITMLDETRPPVDITVVEVTNADGSAADENGPWNFIVQVSYTYIYMSNSFNVNFTGKFYVSKEWDNTIGPAIGSQTVNDVVGGYGGSEGSATLSAAKDWFTGIKLWVTPYASNDSSKVSTLNVYPTTGGYSPCFTGASATADAKALPITALKAFTDFTLVLK